MKYVFPLLLAVIVGACAGSPRSADRVAPVTPLNKAAPVAASAPATASAVSASAAPSRKAAALDPRVNTDLLKQGYHYKLRGDEVLYCRQQAQTGTRFTSNLCLTEQEISDNQQHARDELGRTRAGRCLPPVCNS